MYIFVEIKVKNIINLKRYTHINNEYMFNRIGDIYMLPPSVKKRKNRQFTTERQKKTDRKE